MATITTDQHFTRAIQKLDGSVSAKVLNFVGKLQSNPDAPGLNLKIPHGASDRRVMTARVDDFYRAVLFNMKERRHFLLVTVLPHDGAYRYASRLRLTVNPVHGALEVYEETFDGEALTTGSPTGTPRGGDEPKPGPEEPPEPPPTDTARKPVLAGRSVDDLARLGVAAQFIEPALSITDPLEFERFCERLPMVQGYALLDLQAGRPVDEILADLMADSGLEPGTTEIDQDDVEAAAGRPLSQLQFASGSSEELLAALAGDMSAWRVWLHPTQRKLAYHDGWNGPFRVTGGAGTGKTVTALHRARHLTDRVREQGSGERILLATFTRNLATALSDQLAELAGADALGVVDVINLDALAAQILSRDDDGRRRRLVGDDSDQVRQAWDVAVDGQAEWSREFLQAEWLHVVLAQGITDRRAYFRARRVGRGVPLNRAKRAEVWQLIERFQQHLQASGIMTFTQANAVAAARVEASGPRYRYAIVDEAQDLHPAHWRLLRAITEQGSDDLFLVGDAHQRIYGRPLVLSHYGINTRGRSRRLRVNYRTSAEIMQWCNALMRGVDVDDLEGESDPLDGARSEFHGEPPHLVRCDGAADELERLVTTVRRWLDEVPQLRPEEIGILSRTGGNVTRAAEALADAGIPTVIIDRTDQSRTGGKIQVMTMHRAKGLEFRCVAITRLGADAFPSQLPARTSEEERELHAARERSLLYVAASRAREQLALLYSKEPSPLLPGAG